MGAKPLLWFFDLDNTLHDTSHALFGKIDVHMNAFLMRRLQVPHETADYLRVHYWKKYGATLIGAVRHHGIKAADFLHGTHNFDPIPHVRHEPGLPHTLRTIQGRKVLLTNAPRVYARPILRHLRLHRHIPHTIAADQMQVHGYIRVKPSRALMLHVLARARVAPHRAVLVDDSLPNLKTAHAVGMKTVHIRHHATPFARGRALRAQYVNVHLQSVRQLPRALHKLAARA